MPIESASYVSQLNASNPASGDAMGQGDDQIRLIKQTLVASFPAVAGAVTASHAELNHTDGVTSPIQTQLDAKAPVNNATLIGTTAAQFVYVNGATLGAQRAHVVMGTGAAQQWAIVQEADRSLAIYSYTDAGVNQEIPVKFDRAGAMTVAGLVYGRGGGAGLGQITVSTSDPSGGADADIWFKVA